VRRYRGPVVRISRPPRGALLAGCLLLAPTLLLGCGDDEETREAAPPPPDTTVEVSEATACTLVDAGAAQTVLGVPARPKVEDQPDGVVSQCIWEATDPTSGRLLQVRVFGDERTFSGDVAEGARRLRGLGERAYLDPAGPAGIVDLQFVRDGYVFAFAYSNPTGDPTASAPQVEALARKVEATL
jgi:hypothetical protein